METLKADISPAKSISGAISTKTTIGGSIDRPKRSLSDYNEAINKPSINNVTLVGDKALSDIGMRRMTNSDIERIISNE